MRKRLSKKQMFFNKINLTKDDDVYVGIDAHKESYSVAIWLNDAPAIDFVMPADNTKLVKFLEKVRIGLNMVVYEAGPTGYTLARCLQKAALPIKVIAPSKTPRQSARDSKTDRIDARTLAKYVGLSPTIIQSGQSFRDGPVTKTGRPQLRSNLIQGAWIWIIRDPKAHKTFLRILHNTGHKNKAITAMARRLAIHLWKMICDNKPYINAA